MKQSRAPLWTFIILLLIAAAVVWWAVRPNYPRVARRRVEQVLRAMSAPEQNAPIGLWAKNTPLLGSQEMSWASDHFDQWRREKDLYKQISTWQIVDVTSVPAAEEPTAVVTVNIEGRELRMLVPQNRPISWAE